MRAGHKSQTARIKALRQPVGQDYGENGITKQVVTGKWHLKQIFSFK